MDCPKCGNRNAKYKFSRKKLWKGKTGGLNAPEPRKNFEALCTKCGYVWEEPHEEPVILSE